MREVHARMCERVYVSTGPPLLLRLCPSLSLVFKRTFESETSRWQGIFPPSNGAYLVI